MCLPHPKLMYFISRNIDYLSRWNCEKYVRIIDAQSCKEGEINDRCMPKILHDEQRYISESPRGMCRKNNQGIKTDLILLIEV